MVVCTYPKYFMVSECGRYADFFEEKKAGWTDCSDMSDNEVAQLMVRRMIENKAVIDELEEA